MVSAGHLWAIAQRPTCPLTSAAPPASRPVCTPQNASNTHAYRELVFRVGRQSGHAANEGAISVRKWPRPPHLAGSEICQVRNQPLRSHLRPSGITATIAIGPLRLRWPGASKSDSNFAAVLFRNSDYAITAVYVAQDVTEDKSILRARFIYSRGGAGHVTSASESGCSE